MNQYLYFDTETEAIGPASTGYPEFVAMGWYTEKWGYHCTQDKNYARRTLVDYMERGYIPVAHNLAFDLGVLGIFPTKDQPVYCTMIEDMLQRLEDHDCADSKPGPPLPRKLAIVAGLSMEGKGTTQLSFRPGIPLTMIQRKYLKEDVMALVKIVEKQSRHHMPGGFEQLTLQVRAQLALSDIVKRGIRVDIDEIHRQRAHFKKIKHKAAMALNEAGMYRPKRTGNRGGIYKASLNTKAFLEHVEGVCKDNDLEVGTTAKGRVKSDREFLSQLPRTSIITSWLDYKDAEKIDGTFLKKWDSVSGRIHPRYRLLMRTGRTSSFRPNLQQVPNKGERGEVKKVFLPEKGYDLYELDYHQLELCCLAYLTQGKMLKLINNGDDLHMNLAVAYFKKEPQDITKDERNLMKQANFGLPGGMGPNSFRKVIRNAGLSDPGDLGARDIINTWMATYPEMAKWRKDSHNVDYHTQQVWRGKEEGSPALWEKARERAKQLKHVYKINTPVALRAALNREQGSDRLATWLFRRKATVKSGRIRCPLTYTEAHNAMFQGLAADLTKTAMARIVWRGVLVHAFIHDAFLISAQNSVTVVQTAKEMLRAAAEWIPGVRVGIEIAGPGKNWWEAKHAKSHNITVHPYLVKNNVLFTGIQTFYDDLKSADGSSNRGGNNVN